MKKFILSNYFIILSLLTMLLLGGCLDALGFDPEEILSEINVTGNLDVTDVTSAVLMISNMSRTITVTRTEIFHYEDSVNSVDRYESVALINGKPKPLSVKSQYVKPSHDEYEVELHYLNDAGAEESVSKTVSAPMPREQYWLYLYRCKDGSIKLETQYPDADKDDTGTPVVNNEYEGEGSTGYIPPEKQGSMGVLNVINLTKDQDISYVNFASSLNIFSEDYRSYWWYGEPNRTNQQGITLGMGSWLVTLRYTPRNSPGLKTIGPKNVTVLPLTAASHSAKNKMYFYKNKSGGYDVSFEQPDASVLHPEDNITVIPPDYTGYGTGVIRIVNQTENFIITDADIINPLDPTGEKLEINSSRFSPYGFINPNSTAIVTVIGTEFFNLKQNGYPNQLVILSAYKDGERTGYYTGFYRFLDGQQVELVIRQSDFVGKNNGPGAAQRGTKVTLTFDGGSQPQNYSDYELYSLNVFHLGDLNTVVSYTNNLHFSTLKPIRVGGSADIYVTDNPFVPIVTLGRYRARVVVYGPAGKIGEIEKDFTSNNPNYGFNDMLFGQTGDPYDDRFYKTITIYASDIDNLQP